MIPIASDTYDELMAGEWIPADRLEQIRREFADAGFEPWANPVDVAVAVSTRCARCGGRCRHEGYELFHAIFIAVDLEPQRWALAVCMDCGAGLSF
jgi:hypothetical protein